MLQIITPHQSLKGNANYLPNSSTICHQRDIKEKDDPTQDIALSPAEGRGYSKLLHNE
jgi:hypothetical protein